MESVWNSVCWGVSVIPPSAVAGAIAVPAVGTLAGAAVPYAMSYFGVITAAGTIHASFAAGGAAAILQWTSASLLTAKAVATGAAIGPTVEMLYKNSLGRK